MNPYDRTLSLLTEISNRGYGAKRLPRMNNAQFDNLTGKKSTPLTGAKASKTMSTTPNPGITQRVRRKLRNMLAGFKKDGIAYGLRKTPLKHFEPDNDGGDFRGDPDPTKSQVKKK